MPNGEFGAKMVSLASDAGVREFELGDSSVIDAELQGLGLKILR